MIVFKKIRYKNILSTGNNFTEIDFLKKKTTLIIGTNGAGKSTLLDALCFVLYGKPFRDINKPLLLNSITNKDLLVEVEFRIGASEYLVRRGIKPNVFEIYLDGKMLNQDSSVAEQQDDLETKILKINYKSFRQIVVIGSASFTPFMQLTAKERREFNEDLLNLKIFSVMNVLLKDKITKNKDEIQEIETELKSVAEKLALEKRHKEILKQNNKDIIENKKLKIKEYEEKIDDIETEIKNTTIELEKLSAEIDPLIKYQKKSTDIAKLIGEFRVKIEKVNDELDFYVHNQNCPTCKQAISEEFKCDIVNKKTESLKKFSDAEAQLKLDSRSMSEYLEALDDKNMEYEELSRKISQLSISLTSNYNFIKEINKEIEQLSNKNESIQQDNSVIDELESLEKKHLERKKILLETKEVYAATTPLLKDGGIKALFIKQYIPIINDFINKYLHSFDFFVNFNLNENFEESIKSRFRDEFKYDSFSQGEKARIDLALLFTWRSIAKLRNSAATNLLILDEVFDGPLDSIGTDDLLKILSAVIDDSSVFVISHKDSMMDKFERVLQFKKVKNFSVLED